MIKYGGMDYGINYGSMGLGVRCGEFLGIFIRR